jgi:glucosyl-3-phosphoglycerate synthase
VLRRFDWRSFDAIALAAQKGDLGVSVCIPARNEAATVGEIVRVIRGQLMGRKGLVDQLLVVDDGSTDATAKEAEAAGAQVLTLPEGRGKGEAMTEGLRATTGDIVAYCDADVYDFTARFVVGLVGPLLIDATVLLVKGTYRRPLDGVDGEGGRVTELAAKPLISLFFPDLAGLGQPLAGEWAARRDVLQGTQFEPGYGVELGVLLDVLGRHGPDAIAECDLGERRHRNRPLSELRPQAETIIRLALQRAGLLPPQ